MNPTSEALIPEAAKPHIAKLQEFESVVKEWNEKLNLISRKDIDNLFEKHILHSLAIINVIQFKPGTKVMDIGTGGGFPGLPLAICFPETEFLLVDSIGKKIKAVEAMAQTLGLTNVTTAHIRAEDVDQKFDFIVGRAVTALPTFFSWIKRKFHNKNHHPIPNGLLYLKGGDLEPAAAKLLSKGAKQYNMSEIMPLEVLEGKYMLHVPAKLVK